jgi:hypothetical protein
MTLWIAPGRRNCSAMADLALADDPKSYADMTWQLLSYLFAVEGAR